MILTDSGFWVALGNRRDKYHDTAREAFERWSCEGFATTWPVLTEVCHLLVHRVGVHQAVTFMDAVTQGACALPELPDDAASRMAYLMRRYQNLPMDLADASLVVLAEHTVLSAALKSPLARPIPPSDCRECGKTGWRGRRCGA